MSGFHVMFEMLKRFPQSIVLSHSQGDCSIYLLLILLSLTLIFSNIVLDSRGPARGDSYEISIICSYTDSLSAEFKISEESIAKEYNEQGT